MAGTGIVSSAWAGFELIAKRPVAVLVWAVIYLTISLGPYVLSFMAAGPGVIDAYRQMLSDPRLLNAPPPEIIALQRYQGLQILGALAAIAIVYTAILRAVIFPDQKRAFFLRLSWAELRITALVVILYILFLVVLFVAVLIAAIPIAISVAAAGGGTDGIVTVVAVAVLTVIAVLLGSSYPAARLAMAIPMSVGEDRFRLFEAWTFTRGYGWQLVLVYLIVVVTIVAIQVVLFALLVLGALGAIGSFNPADISAYFARPDWIKGMMGWLIAAGVTWFGVSAISAPILVAPWAEAYRRIAGVKTQDAHAIFE